MNNSPLQKYLSQTDEKKINTGMVSYVANLEKVSESSPEVARSIVQELIDQRNNLKLIAARFKDGYLLADFNYVHSVKQQEWAGTDYEKYLRPSTLYRPTNFAQYRAQKKVGEKGKGEDAWQRHCRLQAEESRNTGKVIEQTDSIPERGLPDFLKAKDSSIEKRATEVRAE